MSIDPMDAERDEAMNEFATTAERQMLRNVCDRIAESLFRNADEVGDSQLMRALQDLRNAIKAGKEDA